MDEDLIPSVVRVTEIRPETPDTRTLRFGFEDKRLERQFGFLPGQFCLVSVMGAGESVFCIASPPDLKGLFEVTVKRVGKVTSAIHDLEVGDMAGFRGPYGNHFPYEAMIGRNLVFVAGGIGLAPLRPLVMRVLAEREHFAEIHMVYGARTAEDILYKRELEDWRRRDDIRVVTAVDPGGASPGWGGEVGLVPEVLERVGPPSDSVMVACGPPVMIRITMWTALRLGFKPEDVITTLEMRMACGVGTCGRCNVGNRYVCRDGPVFTLAEIQNLPDEI